MSEHAHVLVPVDSSSHSLAGLVYALVSFPKATVTALHVFDPTDPSSLGLDDTAPVSEDERGRHPGDRVLERATETATEYGREIQTALVRGTPHREIVEYVYDHDVDHVVMGSHGSSPVAQPFLGHVSEAVVRRVPVSTTIVPESRTQLLQRDFPGRILVPVDGSEQSRAALEYAVDHFPDARITVFHAVETPFGDDGKPVGGELIERLVDTLSNRGTAILDEAVAAVDSDAVVESALGHGSPASAILDHAIENEFDQILMGSHGRSIPARIVLGSVAETVARRSTLPVTLVRGSRPHR